MTVPVAIEAHVEELQFQGRLTMSQYTGSYDLVRLAFKERQVNGTEPFVEEFQFLGCAEPDTLLPADARVVRCVGNETSRAVLAWLPRGTVLLLLHPDVSLVGVTASSPATVQAVVDDIRSRIPTHAPPDTVPLRTWYAHGDRIQSHTRDIAAPTWAEVARNYPAATRDALEALTRLEHPVDAGKLILWHGPPGTGKTTALRALMRTWAPWCDAHYIADPERFFGLPGYIAEVIGDTRRGADDAALPPWRLVIAEDCDEYLRASARHDAGAALGRLLNLADGVLGQGYNTLLLLTTNEDIRRLHPAVTRPGRCLADIEFPEFTAAEARAWLPPGAPAPDAPITLAELYAHRTEGAPLRAGPPTPATGQYL